MGAINQPKRKKSSVRSLAVPILLGITIPFTFWFIVSFEKDIKSDNEYNIQHFHANRNSSFFNLTADALLSPRVEDSSNLRNQIESKLRKENLKNSSISTVKKPVILMWSGYYFYNVQYVQNQFNNSVKRSYPKCCEEADVTHDKSRLAEADAVIMHHWFVNLEEKKLPPKRTPNQLWVLYGKESACRTPSLKAFNGLFNLTMTYRHDSDIVAPYGFKRELKRPLEYYEDIMINNVTLVTWIEQKSKFFAAVISNCKTQSKRENVTAAMKKDIDIFGKCGKPICPRNAKKCDENEIFRAIAKDYKFYFAAENSFSQDYISEKFWRALEIGIVPVVYGGGNYSAEAPPGSYIDSRDFKSPSDLLTFLKKLGDEVGEYMKYFEWRKRYSVFSTNAWHGLCDLCKYMKNYYMDSTPANRKISIYNSLNEWWATKPQVHGTKPERACWGPFWKF